MPCLSEIPKSPQLARGANVLETIDCLDTLATDMVQVAKLATNQMAQKPSFLGFS